MIDIHSHILPMVDDGASSVEMALDLLVMAYEDGTDAVVLTPHLAYPYGFENPYEKIKYYFEEFEYIVKQERIPIKLYLGTEYLYSSAEDFLEQKEMITKMNHSRYLLMEFFFDVSEEDIEEAVELVQKSGFTPIIAHPERYDCVQTSMEVVEKIIEKGALLQLNKGSLLGKYGTNAKMAAYEMMDQHYISFVGSDAHHPQYRSSRLYEDYDLVRQVYGTEYANEIFYDNAKKMLQNKEIRKKGNNEGL